GFVLNYSQNNVIFNNTITQNNEDGFHFYNTFNNTLTNNTVSYNNFEGISLKYSLNNTFINNTIFNNLFNGIKLLANSANNTFTGNKIHNNIASGIRLELANQNIFQNNTFYNNTYYTIFLENNTYGNFFKWNDFIGVHNIGGSHGYDDGLNNIFIYNWWEEHTGVDSEPDGYFDTPYSIDGDASNEDPYPLVSPNNPAFIHTLTIPIVLHPNGGEVLHGVITIQWTEATDSYGLQVTYTIYYSANNGIIWFELISDLTEISYSWDTTTLSNGTLYLVRVEATSNGLTESDDSNAPFTIQNPPISQTILITENADFETLGFEGDGTKGVPYIIEGLYIVDDSSTLIEIRNTAVYFIIRGNYLDGMYLESSGFGIYLFNVINGVIEDNHIYNCTEGIFIEACEHGDIEIFQNVIYSNSENGIYLLESNEINITANTIRHNGANGIFLNNSNDNIISSNTIYGNGDTGTDIGIGANLQGSNRGNGIFLDPADDNTIFNNSIYQNTENGIHLFESDDAQIANNTINDNGANGIFLEDSNSNIVTNNTIYGNGDTGTSTGIGANLHASNRGNGLFLDPADNNIISNNKIYENVENGIYILESKTTQIVNNWIFGNGFNAIFLELSNLNTIFNNILSALSNINIGLGSSVSTTTEVVATNRGNGIFLKVSSENNISSNEIRNNTNYGIVVDEDSSDNVIEWNDFYGNNPEGTSQAYDDGSNNRFAYNYWDDHINADTNGDGVADSHYEIDGDANNFDQFPMATPDGELIQIPPALDPLLFLVLILLILSVAGIGLAYVNRERIKRLIRKRTRKRPVREYDTLVDQAEELARSWEKDLKD
ncbi:MAG: right-handed parallel beta-helix repeat-containing protein, partial [Promethearchaeota archaeon]